MKLRLVRSASVLVLLLGTMLLPSIGARAQDAGDNSAQKKNSDQLEEITVTAEFKKENLQDTPLAISSFSGDNLEERNITSTTQLSAMVPNTVIQPLGAGWGSTISAFVRGIGLADNSLSFEPGVPFYFDGVYNGRPQAAILDLLDLDSVQILRGPQGTLFGKDAIGGAVVLTSKKPMGDNSGYIEATTGSYSRIEGRGSLDVAIVPEKLMMRVSFSAKHQDGYGDILDYTCATGQKIPGGTGIGPLGPTPIIALPPQTLGGDGRDCVVGHEGGVDDKAGRAALRWVAADNLEVNVIGDYTRNEDEAPVSKYLLLDTTPSNGLLGPWNQFVAIPIFGVPLDNRFLTTGKYTNYDTYSDPLTGLGYPNIDNTTHWGVSGAIDYDIPDVMHIKSITAYRRFENDFGRDSDGSPIPFNRTYNQTRHRQLSQEVDLTGKLFDALDWAAGIYYYDAKDSDQGIGILAPYFPFAPISAQAYDEIDDKSYAAFVHGEYHFTDQLSLIAGIRYTLDQKDALVSSKTCCGDAALPVVFADGSPLIPPTSIHIGAVNWSPQVELKYQWTPDLQTYALYSTGFRNGGFGPRPTDAWQVQSFQPEDLKNYEIGWKTEWLDHKLRFNGDFFYEDYNNQQQGFNLCQPVGTPGAPASAGCVSWFQTINVGEARIWGFEGEVQARPVDGMLIQGSLGYTNYYRTDPGTDPSDPAATPPCQTTVNGQTCYPPRTPEWNMALGVQYSIPMGDSGSLGTVTPRFDVHYQTAVFFTDLYNIGQNAYTTVDARTTWDSPDGQWQVAAFGTNILNKYYYNGKLSLQGVLGFDQANPAAPAEWGLTVKRSFGGGGTPVAYTAPPVPPPAAAVAPPPPVAAGPENLRSFQVFFDFDKSDITSAAAKVIQSAADAAKAGNAVRITVTGHTDTVGSAAYNLALSDRRAASVKTQLIADGIDRGEIATIGAGKTGLLVPTADGVREPQNRRAEIVLQ